MKTAGRVIFGILATVVVAGGVYVWQMGETQAAVSTDISQPTLTLAKTDMVKTVSASGAVKSASTVNIYSTQSAYPIQEILVEIGDSVKEGDVLARLDMSRLETEIHQAELNLLSAESSVTEEERLNSNAVTTAENSVKTAQAAFNRQQQNTANAESDLLKAEEELEKRLDAYSYDKAIGDARINLERRADELETARANLSEAEAEAEDFDDYSYQNAIRDAEILLERRKDDVTKAQSDLVRTENDLARAKDDLENAKADLEEERGKTKVFDSYTYDNIIKEAKKTLDRRREDTTAAKQAVEDANQDRINVFMNYDFTVAQLDAADANIKAAEDAVETAKRIEDDALAAYEKAKKDKEKAEADFNEQTQEAKEQTLDSFEKAVDSSERAIETSEKAVENAKKAVENAENLVTDAERNLNDAKANLDRAKDNTADANTDVVKTQKDAVTRAENSLADAQRAYDKAVSDKIRAEDDYAEANRDKADAAKRAYEDSLEALEAQRVNLANAETSLKQANGKPSSSGTNVEIQKLNLEKLYTTLTDGEITATADGVITELNAKVGAPPSGILFVIEDAEDLYVSANIKEYSLASVSVGQNAFVTTDATGDAVFDARVDYISPKAVSPAGSTSVEFEIHATFDGGDSIRIGMNAFINVITDSKEGVYSVPLSAIVTDERGSFVYAPGEAGRTEIPVTIGIKTTTHGEISGDGLTDGMELLSQPVELPNSTFSGTGMMFN
jgi:multidrug efflux pump subunit AcrA (membrane-fusion protein)